MLIYVALMFIMFQCVVVFACALQDNKQSVFYAVTHHGGPPYSAMPKYAVAHTSDFKEVYVGVAVFQHCSFSRHDPLQLLTINDYYICTRTLLVRERIFSWRFYRISQLSLMQASLTGYCSTKSLYPNFERR
jgi:hypothetical protein